MKIPKTIKIGGKTHEVTIKDSEKGGNTNQGSAGVWSLKIWLDKNQAQEAMEETLLHEIIELIKEANDLDISHQSISTMAESIYQVLKDNNLLK